MTKGHVGPYRTVRVLGEGGMGTVYLAEQSAPIRRTVALKLLREELQGPEARARFDVERQALALMDHPHVARVLDAGVTEAGHPYVAMEFVSGLPIDKYCTSNGLSLGERVALFVAVCHAVQHAHQKGVIHRDIKPANILVTTIDGRPTPKVIDFGLAKSLHGETGLGDGRTRVGQVLGTPEYMSPEQADPRRGDVDARTDVYSLGAVLYELLTGDCPLGRETLAEARFEEVLRRLLQDDPERPSGRLASRAERDATPARGSAHRGWHDPRALRGELDWIVLKALDRDRERRYASPSALAADLERYLADQPVEAGPPSALYRIRKFVRRHRVWVGASALVLATLFVGLIVGFQLYFQAQDALERVDAFVAEGLVQTADELWPLHPERVAAMDDWIVEAERLAAQREKQRARLDAIRAQGTLDAKGRHEFPSAELRRDHDLQQKLVAAIERLSAPETGVLARVYRRRALAATLPARTIEAHAEAWRAAARRIASHPAYGGTTLAPQLGLVPLGPDPVSSLEEFAYLPSGELPIRDVDTGALRLVDAFAVVFVLIPAGAFWMGAQAEDPEGPNFDRYAARDQSPVRHVSISRPFLLSKYECTQGQWRRLNEDWRAPFYPCTNQVGETLITLRHPVEGVTLLEAKRWAARHGLRLPTEAEWEYACQRGLPAGLQAAWGRGERTGELIARANMADQSRRGAWPASGELEPHDDGWIVHAPAGSLRGDASGLYDMLGNVSEWVGDIVADGPDSRYGTQPVVDPKGRTRDHSVAVCRGGAFTSLAHQVRPTVRDWPQLTMASHDVGWRPARDLED